MKTSQRNFVVELKSGRRRLTTQANSIWGNTDIKAFIRQAETEAPHLFEPKHKLDAVGEPNEMAQYREPANQLDQSDDASNQSPFAASLVEPMPIDPSQSHHDHVRSIARSNRQSARRPARKAAKRIGESRSGNHPDSVSGDRRKRSFAASVEAPVDELAALDAENRRLKALLIKRLREENLQLRTMLQRLGVV
ncbi:hypothetical protein [Rhizobium sp. CNPSo 3490]|uniref:hypothetical protein n=1 Tax=Rhizobium sp. CNPSo 3490 TaxID=3021407 RepID=UPI00254EA1D5|nr:hypothetical protein [Rhizobium sp. CNPSo 3490]MDK4736878.1 hypothetical protein [Rhizobium sp. CNPSo 3490]